MTQVVISGTGLFAPAETIDNEELVIAFNKYVDLFNEENAAAIEAQELTALQPSSAAFIEKASGIKKRHVLEKEGPLDPTRMRPRFRDRADDEISIQCEMALKAVHQALDNAGRKAEEIDLIIVAASAMERLYPALSIEIQSQIGASGYAFDMNVACSSATFGLQTAMDAIKAGSANKVLVVNPEVGSGHVNYKDRDCHFIFGDIATAMVLERKEDAIAEHQFEVLGSRLVTQFSNNIRNNIGFLNRCEEITDQSSAKIFVQNGRKVFKEVCPMVAEQINDHLSELKIDKETDLKRLWLHQANINMNQLVTRRVLGRDAIGDESPIILDEYANTGCAGSIISFHLFHKDLNAGDAGVICSFGAGYSIGSLVVRKV